MTPTLIALSGPLTGTIIELTADCTRIGRSSDNEIVLPDAYTSRHHCVISTSADGTLTLSDCSSHGTRVNGEPIHERRLEHRDVIAVGRSQLAVRLRETPSSPRLEREGPVDLDQQATSIWLPPAESLYLGSEVSGESSAQHARVADTLRSLLALTSFVGRCRTTGEVRERLAGFLHEAIGADRCLILSCSSDGDHEIAAARTRGQDDQERPISSAIVNQVIETHAGVWTGDVEESEDRKLVADDGPPPQRRSLIAAPISDGEQAAGVIYLDSERPSQFDEWHLQLAVGAGRIACQALTAARYVEDLESETWTLRRELGVDLGLVGDSEPIQRVYQVIEKVAPTDSTVLLQGESGTGKELVARAIHNQSARARGPLVTVNCAVLSEALLESELFGHERGAFTGALNQKQGKVELAEHGTLFLDEVSELSPPLQAKLLRVLQEREFERLGGTRTIQADIRVLAAANTDLLAATKTDAFRADLYYRLAVVTIELPPLRERRDDILLLAEHFLDRFKKESNRPICGISAVAKRMLRAYEWPGNVRELQNAIERAVVTGSTDMLLPEDLPESIAESAPSPAASHPLRLRDGVREAKRRLIIDAVVEASGVYTKAAQLLGVNSNYLHALIRNLGLKEELEAIVRTARSQQ